MEHNANTESEAYAATITQVAAHNENLAAAPQIEAIIQGINVENITATIS